MTLATTTLLETATKTANNGKRFSWINLQPTGKCDGHVHNNFARAAHSLVHIFAVIARLRRERFIEDVNTTTTISFSFFLNLGADPRIQPQRNSPTYDILSELEETRPSLKIKHANRDGSRKLHFVHLFTCFCPLSLSISATCSRKKIDIFVTNKSGDGNILVLN